jgi:hypothetical protein
MLVLYITDYNTGYRKYGSYPQFLRGIVAVRYLARRRKGLNPSNGRLSSEQDKQSSES